jgi:hypothetical protein
MARRTPCTARSSGVLKRSSLSKWFEITGLPVRRAKPDGEAKSAPTETVPTRPSCQPTPALIMSRFSVGMYSNTLQNSASRPSAARRTAALSNSMSGIPLSAVTPNSAKISCWRMRDRSARSFMFVWCSPPLGELSMTGVVAPDEDMGYSGSANCKKRNLPRSPQLHWKVFGQDVQTRL